MSRFLDLKTRAIAKASSLRRSRSTSRGSNHTDRDVPVVERTRRGPAVDVGSQPCRQGDAVTMSGRSGEVLDGDNEPFSAPVQTPRGGDISQQDSTEAVSRSSPNIFHIPGRTAPENASSTVKQDKSSLTEQCESWTEALRHLQQESPDLYAQFEGMKLDANHLINLDSQLIRDCEGKANSSNSSQWFGRLKRFLPAIGSVKAVAMTVSKADPHQIAPYICASVFCALELALNVVSAEDVLLILEFVSESAQILEKWLQIEPHARTYSSPATQSQVRQLLEELPRLYGHVVRLLLSIDSHLNGLRLKRTVDRISQIDVRWKNMFEAVKRSHRKCEAIRSQAEFLSKAQKDGETVLNWISTRSAGQSHFQVMEKTGVFDKYSERGAWLFQSTGFRDWQMRTENSTKRVLWLKGPPGTGKTTLICRIIEALTFDQSLETGQPARICHFYCSAGTGSTSLSCETVIRDLLRQLAFLPDCTVSKEAVGAYQRHEQSQHQKTELSSQQWKELFDLVASSTRSQTSYGLCIDALDECELGEVYDLLAMLGALVGKHPHIFIVLSSQLHVDVSSHIPENMLITIQIGSSSAQDDIAYYVETEMHVRAALPKQKLSGILSAEDRGDLRKRFRDALVRGAQGMFQWVKIWLAIMFPIEPIVHLSEAEDLLRALEGQQPLDESTKDPLNILNEAYLKLYTRVRHRRADRKYKVRAYRVLLSAYKPLTPAEVAEAVSVEDDETLTASVTETYIRELCHNFFVESSSGLEVAHDSAKLFLQKMLESAIGERSQLDDYSMTTCQAELARLCIRVMMWKDHPIWTSQNLHPKEWARRFSDAGKLESWRKFLHDTATPGPKNDMILAYHILDHPVQSRIQGQSALL